MKPVTKVYRKTFQDFSIKTRFLLGNRDLVANPRTSTSTMIDPVGFDDGSSPYHSAVNCLQELYFKRVKPIEEQYLYWKFDSPPLTSSEIAAKPMIMLLGQYSTGKTSFIQYLLGRDYPGAHIGPEPTTDKFVAVSYGNEERIIPGNAAAAQSDKPFAGLGQFGSNFLSKFQISESPAALLEQITFIDTPGVLSGDKQRLGRSYDFVEVCRWFAKRSDMILLLFDAHKLDISDEFRDVITAMHPFEDKIRIVLNKADQISNQQLMRVYGALMWSLGKVVTTPEVVRVYIGSFWNSAVMAPSENEALIKKEQKDLINDLHSLPKNSLVRKVNEMIKRVKQARVHALLLNHLRDQMPTMFGKSAKQAKLIQFLNLEFTKVQQQYLIPTSDFPEYENFREILKTIEISNLPKLSTKTLESLNEVLTTELPELLKVFSSVCHPLRVLSDNMVEEKMAYLKEHQNLTLQDDGSSKSLTIFQSLGPDHGLLSKSKVIQFLATVELSAREMEEIWTFADQDSDGLVNQTEFISALKLVNSKVKGTENN